ncbi:MAG TPA: hypothetical protein DCY91_23360, partial [Cyanobacteria bacterium UBA11370]|nr:hypothetical protein [Cyanobacteria bacterium UBA11370]
MSFINTINHTYSSLIFIDAAVSEYETLVKGVIGDAAVIILDPEQDGILTITEILANRSDIGSIHIVSHGSSGCLYLGNSQLSLETLNCYASQLQHWCSPSLVLYGCEVAKGERGDRFILLLSELTGASVTASTNWVGGAEQGGTWELEVSTGLKATSLAFSSATLKAYQGTFGKPQLDLNGNTSGNDFSTSFTENGSGVIIVRTGNNGLELTEPDSQNIVSATIRITNRQDGTAESLSAMTTGSGITATYNSANGILTLNGSASASVYQQVLRTITYNNTAQNLNTNDRIIEFEVTDSAGEKSDKRTSTVSITGINDAPSFTGNATLAAINEDTTNPSGNTISTLFSGLFSDPDSGSSLSGIAVVGNTATNSQGIWQYSTNGTTWSNIGTVDNSTALALSASTRVRFVPATNYNGTPTSLTVRALDNTYSGNFSTNSTRRTLNTTTNGGTTAISGSTKLINTSITAVNDAPTLATVSSGSYTDTATNDTFSDITGILVGSDIDNVTLIYGISGGNVESGISTLVGTYGTLTVNTTTGAYTYTPNATAINALTANATDSFTFTVSDGSLSASQSFTVNITGANDTAVIGGNTTGSVTE